MKENLLNISLETSTAPIIQEVRGRDYIEYGTDDWRNLYPQFLIDLYYNSSTHAAIINATSEMIAGEDLIAEDTDTNLDTFVKLKKFMANANSKESLHQVIKKISFDFKLQGAYALHIIWNRERTGIAEIYHIPVEKVRAGRPNELGQVDTYYVSADWANTRQNKPYPIKAFSTTDRTEGSQLLYTGLYSPNMDIYYTPDYLAACNWALVDQKVAEFHLNNIANGFAGSYFLSFANGVPTQEERLQLEQSIKEKFTGAEAAGRFVLTFSDDRTRTPEITPISMSDADKQYLALQELLVQNILTGHRCTSPMLMGIKSDTGLGNNADELNSAANFYLNTVVKPFQTHILGTLKIIFEINQMNLPVEFVQLKPITTRFTNQDLMAVMTQDEIREELGLPPLNEDVVVREDFAKVGSMITDGKELPLFDTIEEAEAEAEKMGCSGYHEHELDGKTVYMPCKDHNQITSMKSCNCKLSENSNLQKFIHEFGEDISEDWEMVEEEIVDGEHLHFDFEKELNNITKEKIELTRTPTARPNARSEQDGVNRSYNDYYKVRYVYATDEFLVNKSGTSREFCELMVSQNKVYRKEDLVNANSQELNKGFGHKGYAYLDGIDGSYSLFLFKGGPQCRHFWLRRIYKTSLRNAKQPIKDAEVISYTKALNEGFRIKRNDKLVAIPPQRMKDHGYFPE